MGDLFGAGGVRGDDMKVGGAEDLFGAGGRWWEVESVLGEFTRKQVGGVFSVRMMVICFPASVAGGGGSPGPVHVGRRGSSQLVVVLEVMWAKVIQDIDMGSRHRHGIQDIDIGSKT